MTTRSMTIQLSQFAFEALAGEEAEGSEHVPARLVRDIRCYLEDRASAPPGWRYPDFLRGRTRARDRVQLEIDIDEKLWTSLDEEAERQDVSTAELVEHVALYYGAAVDAGRVTERIMSDLKGPAAEE